MNIDISTINIYHAAMGCMNSRRVVSCCDNGMPMCINRCIHTIRINSITVMIAVYHIILHDNGLPIFSFNRGYCYRFSK